MNCQEWEERIALSAAGDAAPAEAAEVERHVAGCAGCQVFWSGMKQSLEVLREAHREEIAPAHYAVVRARVLAQLRSGRRAWWRQAWVYGLGIAAVAAVVMAMLRPHAEPRRLETRQAAAAKPAEVVEKAADAGGRPVSLPHGIRRKRLAHHPPETILVKLETDNPDVVIYWIAETKGD